MRLIGIVAVAVAILVGCVSFVWAQDVSAVQSDLAVVQSDIKAAQAEDARYTGGLIKTLIASRIAILGQTEAMLQQKLLALKDGVRVQYTVDGHAFSLPASANQMLTDIENEIVANEAKIKTQEAEVARFSGGLTQAVALSTLETLRQTHVMLEQKKVSFKYGLPQYIGFNNADSKGSSSIAGSAAKVTATEASSGSAGKGDSDDLRKAIKLTVLEKGFIPADASARRFQPMLTFKCSYENGAARDIRAFTGTVIFQDLFGKEILKVNITISDPISAGQRATWTGTAHYNQFMEAHQRFQATELQDMKVVWAPASIIFADGTRIGDGSN